MNPLASFLVAVLALLALARATPPHAGNSPADEYFGRFKMSALSIRARLDTLAHRYHERSISDADMLHDAGLVETSLRAWHDEYPHDAWLPAVAFRLEQLYQAVQTRVARERAREMLDFVVRSYPATPSGRMARERLARGFPPLQAEPAPHATPNPYAPRP